MNKFISIVVLISIILITKGYAGGITGYVTNSNEEPVEFASIYVEEIGTGTSTNIEGFYQIILSPGSYTLVFQHLGYKAKVVKVEIIDSFTTLNINLEAESIVLKTVVVQANNEDPAYTIMRKAITKAKYHKQQLNSFEAEVYIKGSGRLIESPFFLKKTIEKEGMDSTASYATESVSKIKYTRPNMYEEEVISIRSTGQDNGTSPNSFIFGSFYDPQYVNAISPLSPKAFAYYKFEYLGTKVERGYEISKIRVIPRSMGDEVFWGEISIIEDIWCIQSTNLNMQNMGVIFNIKQIYEPVEPFAWLPISHKFDVTGKFFGFKFEYGYLSTIGKYKIELNKDLVQEIEIIDEKIEKETVNNLGKKSKNELDNTLVQGGQITRKQFRKLINAYEKEEKNKENEPLVVSNYTTKVDSLAANSDSAYWAQLRPVPLTNYEIKGYHKIDSIAFAEKAELEGDTLVKNRSDKFQIMDALTTYTFKLSENDRLTYYSPTMLFNYNTVEGFNTALKLKFIHSKTKQNYL